MNEDNSSNDLLNADDHIKPKLPSGLNVLTILTFIGCGVFGLLTLFLRYFYNLSLGFINKALESGKDFSTKEMADMQKSKAAIELALQNVVPIMIIGLVGIALCFVGALWMRKFKRDGFWLYAAGELAPVIAGIIIMGTAQFTGIMSIVFGVGIPVIFVILYAIQRKHLTK